MPFLGKSTDGLRKFHKEIQFIPIEILLFILNQDERFQTFSALRILCHLSCVLVSFMDIRALDVIPTTSAKQGPSQTQNN